MRVRLRYKDRVLSNILWAIFAAFIAFFMPNKKKISNRLRSMCLSRPNQLKLASIIFFAFFSRIPKYFYRHFLLVVDVAVEVAVEWLLNSTASGSRTVFGFYCHWQQNRFSILLPIFNGSRSGSRNGSRISKWQQKKKWQQKSRASTTTRCRGRSDSFERRLDKSLLYMPKVYLIFMVPIQSYL